MDDGIKTVFKRLVMQRGFGDLVRYCLIGCTGVALDFLVFAALVRWCNLNYQFANFIGVSCGIVNNFFLNRHLNFKMTDHFFRRLASFYCIGLFGWGLGAACLWLLVERMCLNAVVAKLYTVFVVTAVQFLLNKFVTFARRENK